LSILRSAIPPLAYSFVTLVGWTARIQWEGIEHFQGLRSRKRNFIYAFWHQRQVFFTYTHRKAGFPAVLVSRSRDGELIARTMTLSNIDSIRGSSSRGASEAARRMLEVLAEGRDAGITPDGPKGPSRKVKPGVLYLAQRSGCPILPIANAVTRHLELRRSWDRFHIPLPFSRAAVVYGEPLEVPADADLKAAAETLKERLDLVTDRADSLAGIPR